MSSRAEKCNFEVGLDSSHPNQVKIGIKDESSLVCQIFLTKIGWETLKKQVEHVLDIVPDAPKSE